MHLSINDLLSQNLAQYDGYSTTEILNRGEWPQRPKGKRHQSLAKKDGSREDQEPWNDGDSGGTKRGDQREWGYGGNGMGGMVL
jgi:hypothetical protein